MSLHFLLYLSWLLIQQALAPLLILVKCVSRILSFFNSLLLPEHEGDEANSHDSQVQHVEAIPTEAPGMKEEPVGDDFEKTLDSEDGCKEVVEIVEYLEHGR